MGVCESTRLRRSAVIACSRSDVRGFTWGRRSGRGHMSTWKPHGSVRSNAVTIPVMSG